ncbi:MAG TPA: hypothetical protein DDX39_05650 [Bacteroidales bacterium]|nr:MAG: hypothetical protein A2W98_06920 [Bacteroidetes bacterium GWF2_33_38]OFY76174.1 MAG: hypothetical protein A2265_09590 [Bacteroidetes bacterium RIFOXYA12_FULL_33_9]OFY90543.1 MAG: hypothetical protein A2236_05660 [Bacteroidetes bacterium RIFOXYA2_FULL_33_7]HBF88108.1 hypothetical protein [Bacteroidales bacterium]
MGCKESDITSTSNDYNYTPLQVGNWITYEIEEIAIDKLSALYDTTNYFIKEIITEKYIDLVGEEACRIERFYKKDSLSNWIIKDVWTSQIINNRYQKTEENVKYVRLIFPAELNKIWNGNAYNTNEEQEYEITNIDEFETVNELDFDSVLTVTHENFLTQIEKKYSIEKFAKNVGLVYKEIIDIYADATPYTDSIEKRIKTASIYKQKVIDYGTN